MKSRISEYLRSIGRRGGQVSSKAKSTAAKKNGLLGGRPRVYRGMTAFEALEMVIQGEDWKIAFMNFVDDFRRRPSLSLIAKTPRHSKVDPKMYALLQSICIQLCFEQGLKVTGWLTERAFLPEPWFVSGMKNLYALALKESPIAFRKNNIFVLENFLTRV